MEANYIVLAIPVFFLLMTGEVVYARRTRQPWYRLADSLTDLSCGVLQQVLTVFTAGALVGLYAAVQERAGLLPLRMDSTAAWVACFILLDALYYAFHRFSHESALGWGAHIVHHQSEEYNLSVALRQSAVQPLLSFWFYLPLAVVGFPPAMFVAVLSFNTLYQFWIHTRAVGRLGVLEWVFNTPSHHRVHHASNRRYHDKNYAGMLIVWDRLLGTFQPEDEPITFGVTESLRSWNPLWAQAHYYLLLWRRAQRARRPWDRVQTFFRSPGWNPPGVAPLPAPPPQPRYDARPPGSLGGYATLHFLLALVAAVFLLAAHPALTVPGQLALAAWVVASLVAVGGVLESRRWVVSLETARLLGGVVLLGWLAPGLAPAWVLGSLGALLLVGSRAWLNRYEEQLVSTAAACQA